MKPAKKTREPTVPIGKQAFLHDICCRPGQIGHCRIVGPSLRGPKWVIVEWTENDGHTKPGDVDVVKLDDLDVR